MLRNLRALQRAALQLQAQAACSTASGGLAGAAGSPASALGGALACAMQRLHLQPTSLAAAQLGGGVRQYAAAAGGGGGDEQPPAQEGGSSELTDAGRPEVLATASGRVEFKDGEEALEAWGKAMDDGDWGLAYDIFEGVLPTEAPDEFPDLQEMLNFDPDAEMKEARRALDAAERERQAARWVRRVDPVSGRAYASGKRKTSVALVWLRPAAAKGAGRIVINRRPYDEYFPDLLRRNDLAAPFVVTGTLGGWDVMVHVTGGGTTGQSQAARHGISRALQNWDPTLRPVLKAAGLLSRDSRIVERKKPGLKKARKAFQWVKR